MVLMVVVSPPPPASPVHEAPVGGEDGGEDEDEVEGNYYDRAFDTLSAFFDDRSHPNSPARPPPGRMGVYGFDGAGSPAPVLASAPGGSGEVGEGEARIVGMAQGGGGGPLACMASMAASLPTSPSSLSSSPSSSTPPADGGAAEEPESRPTGSNCILDATPVRVAYKVDSHGAKKKKAGNGE